jgi:simple sugar transport system permease protein
VGTLVRPALAILAALVCVAALLALTGESPLAALGALVQGAFGSSRRTGETLASFVPLALTGLAVAVGFRAGLFNIGAEGQLLMGALAAAFLAPRLSLPAVVTIPVVLLAGTLAGALWGLIPGWLKAVRDANEVITTLMLSYIAYFVTEYLITGPLKTQGVLPATDLIPAALRLPRLDQALGGSGLPALGRLHTGVFVALAALVVIAFVSRRTTFGLRTRLVGRSAPAARYAGLDVRATIIQAMTLSGALAGLAGAVQVLGVSYRLSSSFSPGFGFTGIAIALLGNLTASGVLLAALLFAVLQTGGQVMQRVSGTPSSIVTIVQGLVILFVATRLAGFGRLGTWLARRRAQAPARDGP